MKDVSDCWQCARWVTLGFKAFAIFITKMQSTVCLFCLVRLPQLIQIWTKGTLIANLQMWISKFRKSTKNRVWHEGHENGDYWHCASWMRLGFKVLKSSVPKYKLRSVCSVLFCLIPLNSFKPDPKEHWLLSLQMWISKFGCNHRQKQTRSTWRTWNPGEKYLPGNPSASQWPQILVMVNRLACQTWVTKRWVPSLAQPPPPLSSPFNSILLRTRLHGSFSFFSCCNSPSTSAPFSADPWFLFSVSATSTSPTFSFLYFLCQKNDRRRLWLVVRLRKWRGGPPVAPPSSSSCFSWPLLFNTAYSDCTSAPRALANCCTSSVLGAPAWRLPPSIAASPCFTLSSLSLLRRYLPLSPSHSLTPCFSRQISVSVSLSRSLSPTDRCTEPMVCANSGALWRLARHVNFLPPLRAFSPKYFWCVSAAEMLEYYSALGRCVPSVGNFGSMIVHLGQVTLAKLIVFNSIHYARLNICGPHLKFHRQLFPNVHF